MVVNRLWRTRLNSSFWDSKSVPSSLAKQIRRISLSVELQHGNRFAKNMNRNLLREIRKEEIHRLEKEHQNKLNGSGAGGDTAFLERIKILEAKLEHMEELQRLLEEQRTEVDKLRDLLKQRTAELEQVKHITPNQNNKFKNKTKPGTSHQMKISNTSNHFDIDDDKSQDSFDDDNEKDPDWMKTPRFNKLQNSKVKYLMPAVSAGPDDPSRFGCRKKEIYQSVDDDKSQDSFDDDNEKDPDWMKTPRFNKLQNSKVKYLMPAVSAGPDDPSRFGCRLCCPLVEKISKFVHLCSLLFKESLGFFHMFKFRLKDFDSFQECSVSTCPRAIQLVLVFFLKSMNFLLDVGHHLS
uniref:(California timema) hypothetical protein n=1 Tax=Timema californicum TaxID=61474 RepID=A0A7R9IX67_TIMCA|nr:unnamed protein product [Timema californicum]